MSGFKNSPYGKRLRASHREAEDSTPRRNRCANTAKDEFVPSKDSGDLRTSYHLMDEGGPSAPSKNRIIPSESDALKEVMPPSPRRAIPPTRPLVASGSGGNALPSTPTRRRLFAYNAPSHSNPATPTRRLDTPTDEAYSMSPATFRITPKEASKRLQNTLQGA
ncbi:hypothetical protein CVT25_013033 [Psilocybe cyanescens]|uniref:Uncharacterized protein n=1 Tax=Psilocybe cyanescens TaxID=93625 RepID=A0A409XWN4_PSICY|nr:hypothetical protein CVT25_013033 [Psilocybe cyanescens]